VWCVRKAGAGPVAGQGSAWQARAPQAEGMAAGSVVCA